MSQPEIGNMAPLFTLPDQNGEPVSLKDFRGHKRVILYFYPKAMTPGCTVQACGMRDSEADLEALDTVVLAVSPDPSARLKKFEEKQSLNFTLLSDEDHKVADQYGAWGPKKFMGREYTGILRKTYIIDSEGRLQHVMEKVKTKTHHEDALGWIRDNL
ncbi:MAG: thioredoxin-dependent thiol peroxidase [Pseudohongiellaceae bacterium]